MDLQIEGYSTHISIITLKKFSLCKSILMMPKLFFTLLTSFILWQTPAWANNLDFGYNPDLGDNEKPALILTADAPVRVARVRIVAGGKTYKFEKKNISAGEDMIFSWARNPKVTSAQAYVDVVYQDGYTSQAEVPISYTYGQSLEVDLSKAKADLKKKTLTVAVSERVEHAELIVYGPRKKVLDQRSMELNQGPGNLTIPWESSLKDVVLLDVTLQSGSSYAGFTYSPWFLDIPHQDILFATNSAHITKEEEWKLESTLEELKEVLDKYGSVIPVKLYIGGCTDTVGDRSSNKELSRARARSIAKWLRAHGYDQPIFYHGFGEDWLAVQTRDGVDEQENRRVVYIVSANPPPADSGVPQIKWSSLP